MSHERTAVADREPLYRQFLEAEFQIRNGDGRDGRTVFGCCAPYNQRSGLINDRDGIYFETFQRGAFTKTVQQRSGKVFLYERHNKLDNAAPIGKPTVLEDRPDQLYGEFFIPNTRDGNDALERIREGIYSAFSVGMVPVNTRWDQADGQRHAVRTEAALIEVSLVPLPAYDAPVAGLRSSSPVADSVLVDISDDSLADARVRQTQHQRRLALYRQGIL